MMANGQDGLQPQAATAPTAPATWLNVPCVPAKTWHTAEASPSVFEARLIIPPTAISAPFPSPTASTIVQGSTHSTHQYQHQQHQEQQQHSHSPPVAQPVTPVQTPYGVSEYRPLQNSPERRGYPTTTFLRLVSAPGVHGSNNADRSEIGTNEQNCRLRAGTSVSVLQTNGSAVLQQSDVTPMASTAGGLPWPSQEMSSVSTAATESVADRGSVHNSMMANTTSRYMENDVHQSVHGMNAARPEQGHPSTVRYSGESHFSRTPHSENTASPGDGRKQVQFVNYSTLMSPSSVMDTSSGREADNMHSTSSSRGCRGHDLSNQSHHGQTSLHVTGGDRNYQYNTYHTIPSYGSDNGSGGAGDARLLPVRVRRVKTKVLRQWMIDNKNHPYPSREEKEYLSSQCNMTVVQVSTWFANSRRRIQRIGLQGWINDQVREDEKLNKDKQSSWN